MKEIRYKVDNDFVLSTDDLKILITAKLQRLQEQIKQNQEVDNKITDVLNYW